ncbi:MAG: cytochrome P450 [Myxococcota bacterium]
MEALALSPFPRREAPGLPGDGGRYQLRDSWAQLRDMHAFLQKRRQRFGPSFAHGYFGFVVFSVGDPDLVRVLHLDAQRDFSSRWGWDFTIGELFAGGLMLRDFGDHRQHRGLMQSAFRPSALEGYLETVNLSFERLILSWKDQRRFRFYPVFKSAGLRLALELILGVPGSDVLATRLGRAFTEAVQASIAVLRRPIPPFRYWRGMRGRRHLLAWMQSEIQARRDAPGSDIFGRLCAAEVEGAVLSDEEIAEHLVFLLMAAHDTTASAVTSCVWAAATHPEWQDRAREEIQSLGDPCLTMTGFRETPVLDAILDEALRMKPPAPYMVRRTLRPTQLGPFSLPENLTVSPVSLITHFLPEWWTDPERFDPARFGTERAEHKQHPGLYYPFGGGAHQCLGLHLARLEAKAFLYQLWRQYRVTLASSRPPRFRPIPIPHPADGLPIRLAPA